MQPTEQAAFDDAYGGITQKRRPGSRSATTCCGRTAMASAKSSGHTCTAPDTSTPRVCIAQVLGVGPYRSLKFRGAASGVGCGENLAPLSRPSEALPMPRDPAANWKPVRVVGLAPPTYVGLPNKSFAPDPVVFVKRL
jgi:hypothetical protein